MRLIVSISLLLFGVGMLSCQVEGTARETLASAPPAVTWVRTSAGWERPATWLSVPPAPPTLHPLVVAAGQGLVSILALAACSREPN
jgi:hypothetical protein